MLDMDLWIPVLRDQEISSRSVRESEIQGHGYAPLHLELAAIPATAPAVPIGSLEHLGGEHSAKRKFILGVAPNELAQGDGIASKPRSL